MLHAEAPTQWPVGKKGTILYILTLFLLLCFSHLFHLVSISSFIAYLSFYHNLQQFGEVVVQFSVCVSVSVCTPNFQCLQIDPYGW